jgi:L-rhamnose mutarotase
MEESGTRRIAFVAKVKKERIEEYKEHHKKVWPDMLAALSKAGWKNYSLFLKEDDGTLFGYFES